jgi:hypothetical protein
MSERLSLAITIGILCGLFGGAVGLLGFSLIGLPGVLPPLLLAASVGLLSFFLAIWAS